MVGDPLEGIADFRTQPRIRPRGRSRLGRVEVRQVYDYDGPSPAPPPDRWINYIGDKHGYNLQT